MSAPAEDWASVIQRLLDADQLALRKVTRLLNFFPIRWRAFDFREEREHRIQEVALTTALAVRDGMIRDRGAVYGYRRRPRAADGMAGSLRTRVPDATERAALEQVDLDELGARDGGAP